jgi:hypothetical protein
MFWSPDQFFTSLNVIRGLAALGDNITPQKQAQKILFAKLLLAEILNPGNNTIAPTQKAMYVVEIKLYCPQLFK